MRILQITDSYKSIGGIRSYLKHLNSALKKKGHHVEIYSPSEDREGISTLFTRWVSYRDYAAVKSIIADFKPDIIHAHSLSLRISPLPLLSGKKERIPVVMTVHDFNYVCPRKWMIYKDNNPCSSGFVLRCLVSNCFSNKSGWLYLPYHNLRWLKIALHRSMLKRYVHTFICPSEVLGQWMKKSLCIDNVVHIPNFIEEGFFHPLDIKNYNQLLFVGRLSKEKGLDCLLKAMPLILSDKPDTFLTIIGDGPERKRLESLSHRLGLNKSIYFAGMVANEDLPEYYKKATICLLPSLWMENCPVAGLEALAFGRPLIGSNIGGIPEIIREGRTGLLFRKDNPNDMAEKITLLIKNKDMVNEFGKNAFSFFEQNFRQEKHVEKILAVYSALIQ